jgi:hypothetical protein
MGMEASTLASATYSISSAVVISSPTDIGLAISGPSRIVFGKQGVFYATANTTVDSYAWYLDGAQIAGEISSSVTLAASLAGGGSHQLVVQATRNGVPCSASLSFTEAMIQVNSITISSATLNLTVDATASLSATCLPSDADDQTIVWTSSNETVAKVSSSGLVTAVYPGTAMIIATNTASGLSANATVLVSGGGSIAVGCLVNNTSFVTTISNGSTYNLTVFDNTGSDFCTRKFSIRNEATSRLYLTGNPLIVLSDQSDSAFSIIQQPSAATVGPGETIDFIIKFMTSGGSGKRKKCYIHIFTSDAVVPDFIFTISGYVGI